MTYIVEASPYIPLHYPIILILGLNTVIYYSQRIMTVAIWSKSDGAIIEITLELVFRTLQKGFCLA